MRLIILRPRSEESNVTQRLHLAAYKLFILQQRVRRSRFSKDSAVHTISEDEFHYNNVEDEAGTDLLWVLSIDFNSWEVAFRPTPPLKHTLVNVAPLWAGLFFWLLTTHQSGEDTITINCATWDL